MADEPNVVCGIDFKSTFPFTQIFRSFRIAIHPSKIVLALVAMVLIYIGGRLLDGIWPADYLAVPNEIGIFQATRPEINASQAFSTQRADVRAAIKARYSKSLSEIKADIIKNRTDEVDHIQSTFNPDNVTNTEDKARQIELRNNAISADYARATNEWNDASALSGVGLFRTFYLQQVSTGHRIVEQAYAGQWFGAGGMIDQIMGFLIIGPAWAMRHHPIYFTLLGVWSLLVWSIFGGAIARIAAVQVARDEKISIRQALGFSTAKFLSFVSAPIIPLAIIGFIGFVVFLVSFILFLLPFIGPIIAGVFFFLALAAGFVMTLVLLGLLGGFNLMYPTIAVEGSDSFDAISRSFSYLFARPWRLGFYTIIAAAYGTLCYVFMRYFLKLLLGLTHLFVGLGVFVNADSMQPLWPVMWPNPLTASQLSYPLDHLTLSYGQYMGAWLIACWVYLVTAVLGAFAISFYFSSNTIIYVLMRHEVDATELDDVYLEQGEDELGELPPAPAPVAVPPTDGPAAHG